MRGLGGDRFIYRLSIEGLNPTSSVRGSRESERACRLEHSVTLTASRIDGFDGEIAVSLKNLPAGYSATKAVIHGGQTSTAILLSATAEARPFALEIAPAPINGKQVTRAAELITA